jgi:Domain of unknown function (DUF4872)/Butirosin biosynthesis protein H, N-terminal
MKIENFKPFDGQHCETTATGTLLRQLGIELSEPMLFGLGEGLGFIFWKMKSMDFPFIGGRVKTDILTQNIAKNLNLKLTVKETSSTKKAWENVKEFIDNGQPVGLKLDCFHLQYFSRPFHFAGHYAAIYGYDNENAFLTDTRQQGGQVSTSLKTLALARAEKGPMSSKNLSYTLCRTDKNFDLKTAIVTAIKNNAADYLNPPITNIGYKGIYKTSSEIIAWFKTSKDIENDFKMSAMLMEKAGTGGALFRNLYRDFLKESYDLLKFDKLKTGHEAFEEIAELWTSVSQLFEKVSQTKDFKYLQQASDILKTISDNEKKTMEILATI